jgi:acyl-CoA dehydrogenase
VKLIYLRPGVWMRLDFEFSESQNAIRKGVSELCSTFPATYWRAKDKAKEYPEEFVKALTSAGWLSALIPTEYGGAGLGMLEASIILEEINHSGGVATACHAQMYTMGALLRHGSPEQKAKYLPDIAKGSVRLQTLALTEPESGSDTTSIKTFAKRDGDSYVLNGHKVFISRVQHSDLMLVVARTTPLDRVEKKTMGLSLFLVDLRKAGDALKVNPIETLVNHETNELQMENLVVPKESLVGQEGMGFYHLLDGLNAERILVAAECIGDGYWFIDRSVSYAKQRVVFDKPIGGNQGVQFPIAKAYSDIRAADLVRYRAATKYDQGKECGEEANMAKLLASEASWEAANVAMTTYGGYGMAVDSDIERKFRESRLYLVAPVTNNLVLGYIGSHALGLPRSF